VDCKYCQYKVVFTGALDNNANPLRFTTIAAPLSARIFDGTNYSLDQCKEECDSTDECLGFAYFPLSTRCRTLRNLGEPAGTSTNYACVSYSKLYKNAVFKVSGRARGALCALCFSGIAHIATSSSFSAV
jgi:hypothetical protein